MRLVVSIQSGAGEQNKEINLEENQEFIIGRESGDLVLSDGQLSRQHCKILHQQGQWFIVDAGSRNGVYLNGEKISTKALKQTDLIRIGQTHIRIVELEGSAETQTQPSQNAEHFDRSVREAPEGSAREESPKINFSLDQIEWTGNWFFSLYKFMMTEPRAFFTGPYFHGDIKRSLMFIGASGLVSGFSVMFVPWYYTFGLISPVTMAVQTVIYSVLGSCIFAGILHLTRGFIEAKGEFSNFLRFFAFISLVSAPLALCGIVLGMLMSLLYLGMAVWTFWGFIQAFKVNTVKFIVVCVLMLIIQGAIGKMMFMSRFMGMSSPISMSDNPDPKDLAKTLNSDAAKTMMDVIAKNSGAKPEEIEHMKDMMETMPERAQMIEKFKIGEPVPGQAISYVANVQRGGAVSSVEVSGIVEGEGEATVYKGYVESNGKREDFTYPFNMSVAMVLMAADKERWNAPDSNLFLVTTLITTRVALKIGGALLFAMPKENMVKLDAEPVKVAGLDGHHIKNLKEFLKNPKGNDQANDDGTPTDLIISKDAPLPLMVRGLDRRHKAGYAIQIRRIEN